MSLSCYFHVTIHCWCYFFTVYKQLSVIRITLLRINFDEYLILVIWWFDRLGRNAFGIIIMVEVRSIVKRVLVKLDAPNHYHNNNLHNFLIFFFFIPIPYPNLTKRRKELPLLIVTIYANYFILIIFNHLIIHLFHKKYFISLDCVS